MPDQDLGNPGHDSSTPGPSLELPSLRFGRRRKASGSKDAVAEAGHPEPAMTDPAAAEPEGTEPGGTEPAAAGPVSTPGGTRAARRAASGDARRIPGWLAVAITGAVTGLLLVLGVGLAMRGCEAIRGTSSCGGPGLVVLIVILLVLLALATRVLRACWVGHAGTIALLGLGLTSVVSLGIIDERLLSSSMLLVVPGLSTIAFLLGLWVTDSLDG